jgi:signal transduction histidine kinase
MKEKSAENENIIRILCHDLATPLMVVKFLASRLEEKKIEEITESAMDIAQHVRNMMALEHGKSKLELVPVKLIAALKASLNIMQVKLEEKEIETFFNSGLLSEVMVYSEEKSLVHQVLNNIISNAIKFSPEGSHILFKLKIESNQVFLTIKDNGVGIPKDLIPDLFNKYVKTSRLGTNKEKGTGFGLPLVKTYINIYGGEIFVDSICEKSKGTIPNGTEFTLCFNLVEANYEDVA